MKRFGPSTIMAFTVCVALCAPVASAASLKVALMGTKGSRFDKVIQAYQGLVPKTRITTLYMDKGNVESVVAEKPDIYFGDREFISDWIENGLLLEDLSKVMKRTALDAFIPGMLEAGTLNGFIGGIPVHGGATYLLYNKDLFDKRGIAYPNASWTWQSHVIEACRKLTIDANNDGVADECGIVGMPFKRLEPVFYGFGGEYTDKAVKRVRYIDKAGMEGLSYIRSLHASGFTPSDRRPAKAPAITDVPFYDGRVGLCFEMSSNVDAVSINAGMKGFGVGFGIGLSVVPKGPVGSVTNLKAVFLGMFSTSRNRNEAKAFLEFMASDKGQAMEASVGVGLPTTTAGLRTMSSSSPGFRPYLDSYAAGRYGRIGTTAAKVENRMWSDLWDVIKGSIGMDALVDNAKGLLG